MPKNPYYYDITCSKCGRTDRWKIKNKRVAIFDAKRNGWHVGKKNICPKCNRVKGNTMGKK